MSDKNELPPKMRFKAQKAPPKPKPRPQDPIEQEFWNRCHLRGLEFKPRTPRLLIAIK